MSRRIPIDRFFRDGEGREIICASVADEYDGVLIKDYLTKVLKLSSSLVKTVKYGGVFVSDEAVTMRRILKAGERIVIKLPEEESEGIEPIEGDLSVLYEDEWLLAVDKPSNMPTHPSRGNSLTTLANLVMAHLPSPFVFRAVNRLDRDTAGIVLIAKNQYAAARLADGMKAGEFDKRYVALLSRAPEPQRGRIDAPIEREREGEIRRVVREGGKRAVTEYAVRSVLPDGRAICDIHLLTGRTHQIRVHLSYIGAPLYADFLYGERVESESYQLICHSLSLNHPISGERLTIKSKISLMA